MVIEIPQLKKFLYNANAKGYAGDGVEVTAQRPGFSELEYCEGDWILHDSYAGHYFAPGQEVVYYRNKPVWAMAYSGGMKPEYHDNQVFAHQTIIFLKKSLLAMDKELPLRGPKNLATGEWRYVSEVQGNVADFSGNEKIYYQNKLVFEQNFIGGIIIC